MPDVATILNNAPISSVLAANDIDKGQLYGIKLDPQLPIKIYATYFVIKRIYDNSGIVVGVNAIAIITVLDIGNYGDAIQGVVNDPSFGSITLGSYVKSNNDIDATTLAFNIATAFNTNSYGYMVISSGSDIIITARTGTGASINGGARLSVILTPNLRVFDSTFDSTFD